MPKRTGKHPEKALSAVRVRSLREPTHIRIGRETWWAGVRSGRFPQAVKLGPNITAWRVEDIRAPIKEGVQ
jgi:predicted DNA-binding transcriptional regulator AlpA